MELRVNNYVRTDTGQIGKIIGFKGDMVETDNKRLITYKSSHSECKIKERLIKLIEVGDYVNGCMVINKKDDTIQIIQLIIPFDLKEKDIKSIVTKEQFESMEYKVGE